MKEAGANPKESNLDCINEWIRTESLEMRPERVVNHRQEGAVAASRLYELDTDKQHDSGH